ncbi:MAG: poly-beta-1,6-N-acetyl-D-glucosamine N-deacetylase PgaB [Betaproteobacteria bacterium]|nr:MAG: poly-beta-1,6-N-acetyl-D-glucosamine N-deacetylase PgaB [Betaproteobacteria bacterium]
MGATARVGHSLWHRLDTAPLRRRTRTTCADLPRCRLEAQMSCAFRFKGALGGWFALTILGIASAQTTDAPLQLRMEYTLSSTAAISAAASMRVSSFAPTTAAPRANVALAADRPPIQPLRAKLIPIAPPGNQSTARIESTVSQNAFSVLAYHDILPSLTSKQELGDAGAITVTEMTRHFSWLRDNGYRVVSMQRVLDARSGGEPLPPKSVMITFDDGYKSFHTRVLPVLKLFDFPATLAVISRWIEEPEAATIEYDANRTVASQFMTWDEIRDCLDSGLVEIASHTHDLHHGHLGNPQGNKQPVAVTRRYDPGTSSYESEAVYEARIRKDLATNSNIIFERLGVRPRVIVWPYGAYNATAQRIAAELGMPIGFTLDREPNSDESSLATISRSLIGHDTTTFDIAANLRPRKIATQRVITVDLSREMVGFSDFDESALALILERTLSLKPSIVILRASGKNVGPNARGSFLFWNSVVPVSANLLNRVAWQLRTRAGVRVFVEDPTASMSEQDRLTVFTELGRYNFFAGLVRGENTQLAAATDPGIMAIKRNHPALETMQRVTLEAQCGETLPTPDSAKLRSARNATYSRWREAVALNSWVLLQVRASQPARCTVLWWQSLAAIAATMPDWQQRTIVEIENEITRDHGEATVVAPLLNAYAAGFRHLGYANDDMRADRPRASTVRQAISLESHPVKQR